MKMNKTNKQKIVEGVWGFIAGAMTIGVYYGVKTGRVSVWFFSSMILLYSVYGVRIND